MERFTSLNWNNNEASPFSSSFSVNNNPNTATAQNSRVHCENDGNPSFGATNKSLYLKQLRYRFHHWQCSHGHSLTEALFQDGEDEQTKQQRSEREKFHRPEGDRYEFVMQFNHQYFNRIRFHPPNQHHHDNGHRNVRLFGFRFVFQLAACDKHNEFSIWHFQAKAIRRSSTSHCWARVKTNRWPSWDSPTQ